MAETPTTAKQLPRLSPCTLFEIQSPIWGGGKRVVGLKLSRITAHNEIHFLYRRKSDGSLTFPDPYYFDGAMIKDLDYEIQNVKGTSLLLVPFNHLQRLERI